MKRQYRIIDTAKGILNITAANLHKVGSSFAGDIEIETFVYDGINSTFSLSHQAAKVIDVYIDQGTYPTQIPAGEVNSVEIDSNLLFPSVNVTIKYIKK